MVVSVIGAEGVFRAEAVGSARATCAGTDAAGAVLSALGGSGIAIGARDVPGTAAATGLAGAWTTGAVFIAGAWTTGVFPAGRGGSIPVAVGALPSEKPAGIGGRGASEGVPAAPAAVDSRPLVSWIGSFVGASDCGALSADRATVSAPGRGLEPLRAYDAVEEFAASRRPRRACSIPSARARRSSSLSSPLRGSASRNRVRARSYSWKFRKSQPLRSNWRGPRADAIG